MKFLKVWEGDVKMWHTTNALQGDCTGCDAHGRRDPLSEASSGHQSKARHLTEYLLTDFLFKLLIFIS